jgi:hypothetical protein
VGGILQRTVRGGVLKRFARAVQAGLFAIRRLGVGIWLPDYAEVISNYFAV